MKIFLINRSDVLLFSDDKKLKVGKENGREFIDAPVLPDGRIVLRAIRKPELSHSNWWFYVVFFWIIGILGLFTPRYSRFDYVLDCNITLYDSQTQNLWLRFNHFINKKSSIPVAAVTVPEGTVAQIENAVYTYDKISHRRRKIYQLVSWLMRIAVIVAVCFIII